MFKIFDTIEEFNIKNSELNLLLGYPNNIADTLTYSEPLQTNDGKFAMQIFPEIENLFTNLVDSFIPKENI